VFNTDNLSFYVGEKNEIIPCSKKYTAHVPVLINAPAGLADYINKQDTAVFRLVCNMAKHIAGSEFWSAQVDEIIWNHDQTFDIIPNIGTHTIKLGDIKNYEKKLDKIALFYQKNMAKKIMWDKYETINAAYSNQIICKNKKNTNEPIDTTLTNH
jgi:cell division protein FtsQ